MASKWKRWIQTALTVAVTATLALSGSVTALADDAPVYSLTIQPKMADGSAMPSDYSGTFNVYKVATMSIQNSTISMESAFADYTEKTTFETYTTFSYSGDASNANANARIHADKLASFVSDEKIQPMANATGIKAGTKLTAADGIVEGVYLVTQATTPDGYYACKPFLVFVPTVTDGTETDVVFVAPKLEKIPDTPDEPPHNPPDNPPDTPPTTPPETPKEEEEGGEETEDIGGMEEDGSMNEFGEYGAFTGDSSQMVTYAVIAVVAAAALIVWVVWKRKKDK